jgi:ABC-2 type transport system ATP-binding protein
MESPHAEELALRIEQQFKIAAVAMDGKVRIERKEGHRFVTDLAEAFAGDIRSISVSQPTLEDVFISRTGHRFWTETSSEEKS